VTEFLDILEGKLDLLQCLYCEKVFVSSAVLKKHMRKKKHVKINPRNRIYDRFYVVNYLESGKNWEDWELENLSDVDDDPGNEWDDWIDDEGNLTQCLFCSDVADGPDAANEHMRTAHGVDLLEIRTRLSLSFYQVLRLVNWIRKNMLGLRCIAHGDLSFATAAELETHMREHGCCAKIPAKDDPIYQDARWLFPVVDGDPLLMWIDLDDGNGDEAPVIPEDTLTADRPA